MIAFNLFAKDMRFEATYDNAPVIAKYLKANPTTAMVETMAAPDSNTIANWQQGKFLIAIYDSGKDLAAVKVRNAYVLPIEKAKFESLAVSEFTVFSSEDKAWKNTMPALAAELEAYNKTVQQSAAAAGKSTSAEKFLAYKYDTALAQLLANVLPQGVGMVGFILAALLGAVVSSLAAMLNAASTIFSMDIYKKFLSPNASQKTIVFLGRLSVVVFTFIAIALAPQLGNPKISNSIFTIIQESQGFISPGILAVFVFGFLVRRAPAWSGVAGLLTNVISYGVLKFAVPSVQFLNRMAICFALCLVVMAIMRIVNPLAKPIEFKHNTEIDISSSKSAAICGVIVVVITLIFYVIFSPLVMAK
jgi:SSS family solute:Na+ symporter